LAKGVPHLTIKLRSVQLLSVELLRGECGFCCVIDCQYFNYRNYVAAQ